MTAALTQGWLGFALGYTVVQGAMIVALARGARARLSHYVLSPVIAAPLTAAAAAGIGLSSYLLAPFGVAHQGLMHLGLATAVSAALGYCGGNAMTKEAPDDKTHRRGALVSNRSADRQRSRRFARDPGLTLAGTEVPAQDETKHFKLVGTTGTGKSTAVREILSNALARGDRAVIADPDGGYLQRFYRPERGDVVLNPFDERSVKWDLFAEIKNTHDVEQLARSLIPDHDGHDRSWREYARTFFSSVTRQAHESGIQEVEELFRLLVVADAGELRKLVRGTPAQPFLDENNSRMFDSIRSVTSSAVGALAHVARQQARGFSVRQWIGERSPGVLFLPYKAGQIAALRSTISAWMRLAIFEVMDQDEPRGKPGDADRLWFVVDELDALGQIDGLKDALARVRKFGGRCILGFQSIAQVSSTYGQGDAHTIVENCGNTLILRCSASEGGGTARFASQLIGEREVTHTSVSKSCRVTELWGSVTRSEHRSVEPAVLPSQVEQLPDLAGYLKYASDPQWQRVRLDAAHAWRELRGGEPGVRCEPLRGQREHGMSAGVSDRA